MLRTSIALAVECNIPALYGTLQLLLGLLEEFEEEFYFRQQTGLIADANHDNLCRMQIRA